MNRRRWQEIDRVFAAALERPPAERPAVLDEACGGDAEMRREVEELLDAEEAAQSSFLEDPPSRATIARAIGKTVSTDGGRRIGPYQLLSPIGRGGMSDVYVALRDEDRYQRRVAVKLIRRGFESPEVVHRFRNERQILARLEHPSIARLYEGGTTDDGRPFLVMEYIEGLPIDQYCDQRRLSVEQRLELFRDVCGAVHFAHQNLLVHRDLKPANILVTTDGQVKLLDFGIAKLLAEDPGAASTRTGSRPMTPGFASPEQVGGGAITTATDVYSLGVLLYHLLTGRGPYVLRQELPHELELAILEQEPGKPSDAVGRIESRDGGEAGLSPEEAARKRKTTPRELRRRLSGDLDTIVLMALRKQPERRYPSARELAADVESHLVHRPVAARPDSLGYRLGKFVRRNTVAVVAGCAMTVGLVVFSAVTGLQAQRIAEERDTAERERVRAQQVSDFLMELFEGSDPNQTEGDDLSVREVLDRSAAKIEQLEDQPELQATYLNTMGMVYRSLGLYDVATPLLGEALRLDRRLHGEESPEAARSLNELAKSVQDEGDFERAESLFREALSIRRRHFGTAHLAVAESLNDLALLLYYKGDHESAEPLYREAVAMTRKLYGDEHPNLSDVLANLALVLHEQGDYEAAEPIYREALAMTRKLRGAESYEVATSLNNLASLLLDTGDLDGAEELFRESLALRRHLFGEEHPAVSIALNNLAWLMCQKGDNESAEPLFRQALAMGREVFGEDHPRVANTLTGLARLLLATGRTADGEAMSREALAIYGQKLPLDHFRAAYARSVLGGCLTELGRHEEAEAFLTDSYPMLERTLGRREPMTRDSLDLIVEHYEKRGLPAKAAEYRALRIESR